MTRNNPEMTAGDVIKIAQLLNQNNIDFTLDGGWAVDALLGEQTRPHADLDITLLQSVLSSSTSQTTQSAV